MPALDQIERTMATAFGSYGIRINNINPAVVLNKMGNIEYFNPKKFPSMNRILPLGIFPG